MNIAHIRYFIAAVEKGSYAAAASSCYVTVQTVSKAISALEREAGGLLFSRTATGVVPTELGRAFYRKATRVETLFGELEHVGEEFGAAPLADRLTVAVTLSLYRGSLVDTDDLLPFAQRYPHIDLVFHSGSSAECIKAAEAGAIDVALVTGKVAGSRLEVREVARTEPLVLMDGSHPLAVRESIALDDLRNVPIATPYGLTEDYLNLIGACERCGFTPRFADVIPTIEAHRRFLRRDAGIVFVIESAWLESAYPGCVTRPFRAGPHTARPVCLAFDPARARPAIEAFCRFVVDTFRRLERGRGI